MVLNLSLDQRKEIKAELDKIRDGMNEALRRYYRQIFIPTKSGLKDIDLGIPTYGERRKIDGEIYEKLRSEGEILEQVVPIVVKERYLKDSDQVSTEQLSNSGFATPGETRVVSRSVRELGIAEGVRQGLFGLGELLDWKPVCRYFREQPSVGLVGNEVLIREEICRQQREEEVSSTPEGGVSKEVSEVGVASDTSVDLKFEEGGVRDKLELRFSVPRGGVASLMGVLNFLHAKFSKLKIYLSAEDGQISEQEYEDKVKEAFKQMGIDLNE